VGGDVRVRSGPKAELHTPLVFLADVVRKRDVELCLDLWVAFPVPFRKTKERPVARVIRKGFSERVTGREVDPQVLEPPEQIGIVRAEQITEVHTVWISAPLEKEAHKVESSGPER
jgi:hypothetical protein